MDAYLAEKAFIESTSCFQFLEIDYLFIINSGCSNF